MSNYTKSFNFRNGVQVDDDNFVVNAAGLVGIGTTKPEKFLDVRGNASITGITSLTGSVVTGVITAGTIKIDAVSGVLTATKFVGDASGLQNIVAIATDGWFANAGSLSTTAKVGIGTLSPESTLDVLGDTKIVGFTTLSGITTSIGELFANQLSVSGVSTFKNKITLNDEVRALDNVNLKFGTFDDDFMTIAHEPNHNVIRSYSPSIFPDKYLYLQSNNRVIISNTSAGTESAIFNVGAGVTLKHNTSTKFETTAAGVTVTGTFDSSGAATAASLNVAGIASASGFQGNNGGVASFPSGVNATLDIVGGRDLSITRDIAGGSDLSITRDIVGGRNFQVSGITTLSGNVNLPDNATIKLGNIGDLQIVHDSGNSIIKEIGAGLLFIQSDNEVRITNTDASIESAIFDLDNKAQLNFANVKKFETISIGASVYGQLNIASLNGGPSSLSTHFGSIRYGNTDPDFKYSTRRSLDLINTDTGNVNFYLNLNNTSGPAGNFMWFKADSPKMTLVTNTGNLGIGKTNPTEKLHVAGIITTTSSLFVATDLSVKGNLEMTGASSQIIANQVNGTFAGDLTGLVNATTGVSTFKSISATDKTNTQFDGFGINKNPDAGNMVDIIGDGGEISTKLIVANNGTIAIGTDRIDDTVNINALQSKATLGAVGVGTTNPQAVIDFKYAGQSAAGAAANRMYAYLPTINTTQVNALVGMTLGALVFDSQSGQLKFYNGSNWVPV